MTDISIDRPSYPMLGLVVRHGNWVSTALAVVVALLGIGWGYAEGSAVLALTAVFASLGLFVVARTLVELVRLVSDMLLPR